MQAPSFRRILGLCLPLLAFCGTSVAGPVTIDFTGSVTSAGPALSHFWLLYFGTDGTDGGTGAGFAPLAASNCNAGTCDLAGTININFPPIGPGPDNWAPTTSVYTIVGYYGGGPGVFVLNGAGVTPQAFLTQFNYDEAVISNDIFNGWTNLGGRPDAFTFVSGNNIPSFPSITLGGASSGGFIFDYTDPEANGSATLQAVIQNVNVPTPEPSTISLMAGALAVAGPFSRRRRS